MKKTFHFSGTFIGTAGVTMSLFTKRPDSDRTIVFKKNGQPTGFQIRIVTLDGEKLVWGEP